MVNSNLRNNGLEQSGTAFHMYHKQSPTTIKKVALRDVQNLNRSFPFSQLEYCYDVGGKNANAVKGSGIKRSMPEMHQSSPSCKSLKSETGASLQVLFASERLSDGYTKFQVPQSVDLNVINDQKRAERLIRLQRLLKQCDESDHREYIQMLLHLSPIELSKHAIELEKRSMQLSVEEGKEIKRMQALYIFGKS
ncbi:Integral membrane protein hemolysin-III-like [Quillaja saponaria]|uniref:Integral membrane protein hemolysin-III-like n=1 Tax=Quillaja saponaria TaxID=32244 RepID=A0AAD7LJ49_QUISA|nr:Integral membrane protein hemolysin-III-like [Quillaja saponaria]